MGVQTLRHPRGVRPQYIVLVIKKVLHNSLAITKFSEFFKPIQSIMNVTALEPCAIYSLTAMVMNNIRANSFWRRGLFYAMVYRFSAKVSEGLPNFMFLSCFVYLHFPSFLSFFLSFCSCCSLFNTCIFRLIQSRYRPGVAQRVPGS